MAELEPEARNPRPHARDRLNRRVSPSTRLAACATIVTPVASREGSVKGYWQRVKEFARIEAWPAVIEFALNLGKYDLLTTASAIAFRVLFAFVPLAAAALAFLGLAGLGDLYHEEFAPAIEERATPAQFGVVNTIAESILGQGRGFWLTLGLVIAVWEVSGAVRGAMGALNRVYGRDDTRSFWRRMGVSMVLGLVVSLSFAIAIGALGFGNEIAARATDSGWGTALSVILRIGVAGLAAFVGVAVLIRFGTSKRHSAGWLGFVSVLVVALWIAATFILTWYFRSIVDYRSVFGTVTSFIVLLIYLYWISILLLAGALADAMLRERLAVPVGERRSRKAVADR